MRPQVGAFSGPARPRSSRVFAEMSIGWSDFPWDFGIFHTNWDIHNSDFTIFKLYQTMTCRMGPPIVSFTIFKLATTPWARARRRARLNSPSTCGGCRRRRRNAKQKPRKPRPWVVRKVGFTQAFYKQRLEHPKKMNKVRLMLFTLLKKTYIHFQL